LKQTAAAVIAAVVDRPGLQVECLPAMRIIAIGLFRLRLETNNFAFFAIAQHLSPSRPAAPPPPHHIRARMEDGKPQKR
jgi:hypothetical protein